MIGYAVCGSFCTHSKSIELLKLLKHEYVDILPIVSFNVRDTDTRFGTADGFLKKLKDICQRDIVTTIKDAEPLGPKIKLDALVIAPCTGNTLAKMANGITDTPVTMAAKAHLRSGRALVIALATNDGLSSSLENIAKLLNRKNVYFTPMKEDDPINKPYSLVADFSRVPETLSASLKKKEIHPLFI